jgi:Ethanolamine utilization protein EutJ (predicted chaperonin)
VLITESIPVESEITMVISNTASDSKFYVSFIGVNFGTSNICILKTDHNAFPIYFKFSSMKATIRNKLQFSA